MFPSDRISRPFRGLRNFNLQTKIATTMENMPRQEWEDQISDGENQIGHLSQNESRNAAPDRENEDDEESESGDWGDVDPQDDPLMPPGPMDPSGPGSAV